MDSVKMSDAEDSLCITMELIIYWNIPLDLAETIHKACSGVITDKQVPLGCHANMITVQKPRHANSSTLYWHHGNIVQDITEIPYSQVENAIQGT